MTAIGADDAFASREVSRASTARERLRPIRTELTMMLVGFALLVFATVYGLDQL